MQNESPPDASQIRPELPSQKHKVLSVFNKNLKLKKYWCEECQAWSFSNENTLVCCGSLKPKTETTKTERATTFSGNRRAMIHKNEVLERDNWTCRYCGRNLKEPAFYSTKRSSKLIKIIPTIDHFTPHSFEGTHQIDNLLSSCNLCNYVKNSKFFDNIEHAKRYIMQRKLQLGVIE